MVSLQVIGLPSVNTHYNKHHHARANQTRELKLEGRELAQWWMFGRDYEAPVINRAFVLVDVFTPHEGIMDIHNVHVKDTLDGFTEAGLWADDEWATIPLFAFRWAGHQEIIGRKWFANRLTIFHVYDLTSIAIRGRHQLLPKGRRRLL